MALLTKGGHRSCSIVALLHCCTAALLHCCTAALLFGGISFYILSRNQ
ncbi:hypothetical protein [Aeromonas hydrophila]|nr:hypothetical protein [Aeromonas hydrophila]MCV3277124.1 hypothetical protein [Aeromonas hydrophila]